MAYIHRLFRTITFIIKHSDVAHIKFEFGEILIRLNRNKTVFYLLTIQYYPANNTVMIIQLYC